MDYRLIITHPGSAHKDDFLACSVMLHYCTVPVERREPTEEELEDPSVCVLDVGGRHEPEKGNFDHHQFPRDHEPICALSLVLQHAGVYDDAKQLCDWVETAEWFDSKGALRTAAWLDVSRKSMSRLSSTIDMTCLRRFAMCERFKPGDIIWEMMKLIGDDLVLYIMTSRERVRYLDKYAEIWDMGMYSVLYLPRHENMGHEPSAGMLRYIETNERAKNCVGLVYPDSRGSGYGMSRYNDEPRFEFTKINDEKDVHFTHNAGFVAKTGATEVNRLKELLNLAWIG